MRFSIHTRAYFTILWMCPLSIFTTKQRSETHILYICGEWPVFIRKRGDKITRQVQHLELHFLAVCDSVRGAYHYSIASSTSAYFYFAFLAPFLVGFVFLDFLFHVHCVVDRSLSIYSFCFDDWVVCLSSLCGFWLPLWFLPTLLFCLYLFIAFVFFTSNSLMFDITFCVYISC